ncbi:SRJ-21 protein [Aphelenchoides avenae]|nr:SRJ-21 protein [Aphelenchus avenae]
MSVDYPNRTQHNWNLRDFSHASERTATVCSLICNTILSVLLIREKNEVMKPYSRVLLQNCVIDYLYTLVCMIVEIQIELNQGVYIFVVNGFLKHLTAQWQYLMIGAWMFSFSLTLIIVPVEFTFRYMLVCKKYMLNTWQLLGLGAIVSLALGLAVSIVSACLSVTDHKAEFGHLMQDPLWFDDGKQVVFFGADKYNPLFIVFLILAIGCDSAIYAIMVGTGIAVLQTIKRSAKQMSAKTKYMQSQMNRVLIAEAGSVTIVGVIPVGIGMYLLVFNVTCVGLGIWLTILFAWIPIVNPLTTICLVHRTAERYSADSVGRNEKLPPIPLTVQHQSFDRARKLLLAMSR